MLITDTEKWDRKRFDAFVEGMCFQLQKWPYQRVPFVATLEPQTIFLLFAIWKMGKVACPLSFRLPSYEGILKHLKAPLFTPQKIVPRAAGHRQWDGEQMATIMLTSGTSKEPKLACHSLSNHLYSALGFLEKIPLCETDRWQLTLPLYHVAGIGVLLRCYLSGASIVLTQGKIKATHISVVPTQLLNLKTEAFKAVIVGGAPLVFKERKENVFESYGLTEMSSTVALNGEILPYRDVKIEEGEIYVRGKTLFVGYDEEPFSSNEWFATKDLGYWDGQGKLHVSGRKDALFISGGENIQPEEVEWHLKQLEGILDAVVVGASDPVFGKRPVAFLHPCCYTQEEVQERLISVLPKFKIPVKVFPMPPFEGKPLRSQLQIKVDL